MYYIIANYSPNGIKSTGTLLDSTRHSFTKESKSYLKGKVISTPKSLQRLSLCFLMSANSAKSHFRLYKDYYPGLHTRKPLYSKVIKDIFDGNFY